jgi:hypothetical protein
MASAKLLELLKFTLTEGVYVCGTNIYNPNKDKRVKNQFDSIPVWKRGLLVMVKTFPNDEYHLPEIRVCAGQDLVGTIICFEENRKQWEVLCSGLAKPRANKYRTAMAQLEFDGLVFVEPQHLLMRLLENGLEVGTLLEYGKQLGAMSDDGFSSWIKTHSEVI